MGRVNQFYESGDDDMSKLNNEKWESVLKKVVKTSFICVTLLSSAIFWSFGKKKKRILCSSSHHYLSCRSVCLSLCSIQYKLIDESHLFIHS